MSKSKGSKYERRQVEFFDAAGFQVMKAPGSGGGTDREQPDVLAVREETGEAVALESKYVGSADDIVYLTAEEVAALRVFAAGVGALPRVAARWYRDPAFYLYHPDALDQTDGGNFRIHPDDATADAADEVLADPGVSSNPKNAVTPESVEKYAPFEVEVKQR